MGTLYVVATPIGNLGDITFRAVDVLKSCDLIVCEDTRVTRRLLSHYEIKGNLLAVNAFNEGEKVYEVVEKILDGVSVAVVSDSGTPLVSDPGYLLVTLALKKGVKVVPVPGASAVTTALSAAGIPTDSVLFLGFLPKKEGQKKGVLLSVRKGLDVMSESKIHPTVVLYESPQRLVATLELIKSLFGDINVTIARELTKVHEEFRSGSVVELIQKYSSGVKGEICVMFHNK